MSSVGRYRDVNAITFNAFDRVLWYDKQDDFYRYYITHVCIRDTYFTYKHITLISMYKYGIWRSSYCIVVYYVIIQPQGGGEHATKNMYVSNGVSTQTSASYFE